MKTRTRLQPGIDFAPDHIKKLQIRDFKSIRKLDLELGQVNVFVGPNGSGKSNILEAIGILGAAAAGRIDDQALLRRGVRPGVPELYKSAFKRGTIANAIEIRATSHGSASYRINITNPIHSPKPWWVFQHERLEYRGKTVASRSPKGASVEGTKLRVENYSSVGALARARIDVEKNLRDFLTALDDYSVFAPVTPVLRGIAPDTAPRNPVGLFGGQLPEAVAMLTEGQGKKAKRRFLDEALELVDWAENFDVTVPSRQFISPSVPTMRQVIRFHDRYMRPERNKLSGYDASEGALYILFMLALALHEQSPRCLAIDNFDQALNPRTARGLTSVFSNAALERGKQAILTTHNPLVLDGLPLSDSRVRLFAVGRSEHGETTVRHVAIRDLETLKRESSGDAVSRLWLMGRLGGMPNVSI